MPPARVPLPRSVDDLVPDWLNAALPGLDVTGVRAARIGQDEGFSGCRLFRLTLDHGGAGPSTLVAKLSPAGAGDAGRMAAANAREVAFYAAHGDAGLPVPSCPLALRDAATGASLLLLQDLGGHRALPFQAGLGLPEAGAALRALAVLHARCWDRAETPGGEQALQRAFPFEGLWPAYLDHVARTMPEGTLPDALRALGDRIAADPEAALARLARGGPPTRLHGDAQADNLRFSGEGAMLLDWQMTGWGAGLGDVGYLMISSLPPALRRRAERGLLGTYAEALAAHGITVRPDPADLARTAAGKLWVTVAATLTFDNAGPARQRWRRTDLERLAAFCADHDPAGAFG